jgi:hypothetical protein
MKCIEEVRIFKSKIFVLRLNSTEGGRGGRRFSERTHFTKMKWRLSFRSELVVIFYLNCSLSD